MRNKYIPPNTLFCLVIVTSIASYIVDVNFKIQSLNFALSSVWFLAWILYMFADIQKQIAKGNGSDKNSSISFLLVVSIPLILFVLGFVPAKIYPDYGMESPLVVLSLLCCTPVGSLGRYLNLSETLFNEYYGLVFFLFLFLIRLFVFLFLRNRLKLK